MCANLKLTTVAICVFAILTVAGSQMVAQDLDPRLKNFDIGKLVRIENTRQAEALREKLVRFIWPDGLPTTRPKVTKLTGSVKELAAVNGSLIDFIERYDVDVSNYGFDSHVYVAYPKRSLKGPVRLSIVFAGHMPEGEKNYLASGLDKSVDALLKQGFIVAVMQMPLVGWNRDTDGVLAGDKKFQVKTRGTRGHNDLFSTLERQLKGGVFRFFLEPIVQTINEWHAKYADRDKGLLMIGLSGGGWTTHMAAAIDPRIDISLPVAGSLPLYARPFSRGSRGDSEQFYAPLYGESDSDGDGVLDEAKGICTWLEVYALGGLSPDAKRVRQQIQVLNLYDSCCFGGPVFKTYAEQLTKRVADFKSGSWKLYSDKSHRGHLISAEVIEKVLLATIKKSKVFAQPSNSK